MNDEFNRTEICKLILQILFYIWYTLYILSKIAQKHIRCLCGFMIN